MKIEWIPGMAAIDLNGQVSRRVLEVSDRLPGIDGVGLVLHGFGPACASDYKPDMDDEATRRICAPKSHNALYAAELDHLRECMRIAGLQAFKRDRPPQEVAEHLRDVISSYETATKTSEQRYAGLRSAVRALRGALRLQVECGEAVSPWLLEQLDAMLSGAAETDQCRLYDECLRDAAELTRHALDAETALERMRERAEAAEERLSPQAARRSRLGQ